MDTQYTVGGKDNAEYMLPAAELTEEALVMPLDNR